MMKAGPRRIFHRLFFAVAALTTLVSLFYAEENWRGARAWAAAKRDLQARGEPLDIHDLIPPPVPDDQNLAMAPLFVRMFRYRFDPETQQITFDHGHYWTNNDTFKTMSEMPWGHEYYEHLHPSGTGNWMTGHATGLPRLQAFFRQRKDFPYAQQLQAPADDILLALTRYAPLLDELAQDTAARPLTRFPVNWTQRPGWGVMFPHYSVVRSVITALSLRATAELVIGQTAAARHDLVLALHLRHAVEHDPILIAGLVDSAFLGVMMQPIWEGLSARQWSADDLDAFGNELRTVDALQEFQVGMRGERVFSAAQWPEDMQNMARAREIARILPVMTSPKGDSLRPPLERWLWPCLPYMPRGWYALNAAYASRYLQENAVELVDPGRRRVWLDRSKGVECKAENIPVGPGTFLARASLPVFATVVERLAQAQVIVDEAVTACALEKYYLDHHAYPDGLAALVPAYLDHVPSDVIDGAALRYRRTVDGRYQLYSVGWDGQDGGGVIAWPPDRTWRRTNGTPAEGTSKSFPSPVRDRGDWVWQYAPAEPPDPPANESRLESAP